MRALLVAFHFPPSGGSGVQRVVKLCRRLPQEGFDLTVVTVTPDTYLRHGAFGALDSSLVDELPPGIRVVRTDSGDRPRLRSWLRRAHLDKLAWRAAPRGHFERLAGWGGPCLRAVLDETRRARPDVLLTSAPPYVVHLVGREVHRREAIPWVADFRDPWTRFWPKPWPSKRAMLWEEDREAEVVADADGVIANTPGQRRELVERYPHLAAEKIASIPNGYDPSDFHVASAPRSADEVLVVHAGHVNCDPPGSERKASAAQSPFDFSTDSYEPLLQALLLLRGRPDAPKVRVRLIGKKDAAWARRVESLGLSDRVDFVGYVPHAESVSHLLAADLLYLPTIVRNDGRPSSTVHAKTYEYLGSGRPIAAMTEAGDVRDLLTGRPRCTALPARDAAGLADLLARIVPGRPAHALPPDPPDAHPWRREEQARQMADVLRRVAGAGR